jgi:hypothetical protein
MKYAVETAAGGMIYIPIDRHSNSRFGRRGDTG